MRDEEWATAPAAALGIQINGGTTSNRVEQFMDVAIKLEARHENPLVTLFRMAEYFSRVMAEGRATADKSIEMGNKLIPYANEAWEVSKERFMKNPYTVNRTGGVNSIEVIYNGDLKLKRTVNLLAEPIASCSCMYPAHEGLPCHHIIAVLFYYPDLVQWTKSEQLHHLYDPQYFVEEYDLAYSAAIIIRPRLSELKPSATAKSPKVTEKKKRGGSNKRKRLLSADEPGYAAEAGRVKKKTFRPSSSVKRGDTSLLPRVDPLLASIGNLINERESSRGTQENTMHRKVGKVIDNLTGLVDALYGDEGGKTLGAQVIEGCRSKVADCKAAQEALTVATRAMEAELRGANEFSMTTRARVDSLTESGTVAATVVEVEDEMEGEAEDASSHEVDGDDEGDGNENDEEGTLYTDDDFTEDDLDVLLNAGIYPILKEPLRPLAVPDLDDEIAQLAIFKEARS